MKRNGDGGRASARDVLRTARFHVQQLGATLALSEAAADLVVFHRGSASFLEAAHVKFKTVVCPDYLAACVAADQRVSIAPYVVSATAATCTTPARQSTGTSSSAVPASHTSAASPGSARRAATAASDIPHSTGWGAKSSRSTRRGAAAVPSRATRSPPKCGAKTSAPAEGPTNPPLLHRLLLLDDDEDGGKADHQQQQQRGLATLARVVTASKEGAAAITAASPSCTPSAPRAAPSTPTNSGATKPHHLIADIQNSETSAIRCAPGQLQSDGAGGQQRRRAARAKRGVHQESTVAFELDEDITQQPSTDTASTPRLTPSSRYEVGGCRNQGVSTMTLPSSSSGNERVAAAVERWDADTGEEEAIRHAVLRSTATAAVTRRRGRPHREAGATPHAAYSASLPAGGAAGGGGGAMGKRSRDPFLNSDGSSRQLRPRAAPAPSPRELRGVSAAVTEPLAASSRTASIAAAQPQTPSAASVAPTRTTAKRPRSSSSSSSVADSCAEGSIHHTRATPSDTPQGSRQRRRKQEDAGHGAAHDEASKSLKREQQQQRQLCARRRRRISGRGRAEVLSDLECAPAAELPLSMTFTDLAFLRRLASEDEKVGVTAAGLCVLVLLDGLADADAAAATLSSFLRDVVEQLGATCVVLGGDDDDSGGCSCWFGRHKRAHAERVRRAAKKPTHLVVSPHAVLTPDILFCKALGIPIVTPQWLYDAVALGAFPAVLPHVHAHPVYGDRQVADAAVAVAAPVTAAGVPRRHELLGVEEDDGDAVEAKAVRAGEKAGTRCPPRCGGSSTLRQLRKEVAEEYVPAGEQAMRPFYVPIFQDRMFYLHVPPADLANANAAGGGAGPPRSSRASRNGRSGNYLGDATAALAQVKELLRVLGGTVTRNVGSTYLDLVIDLTGFYDNMVKLGLTAREQQSQQQQQQARALRESLSCAFQDALQRVSLQPVSMDAGAASTASPTAPPVVGIAWLIHSILTRQWTATDPFALTGHPLTVQIATVHPRAQIDGTEAASATVPCEYATGSGAVAAPAAEDALVAAGAPAAMGAPYTHTPSALPSHEEAAESLSGAVWSAVVAAAAAPRLKHTRGPQAALKHASHQLGTQEIAAMLSDAQLQSVGVSDAATPSIPEPAHPPHQSVTTPFCMEEEDSLAFARIQYSDGDFDGVV
ncbi:conserved hypothetical protein [Leishmania major strain Friedlin]|uniref:BRCT domain-containing protein n=1 Tax=Leishmania major TaxID=5664 RepID=Q4Q9T2_LEIMA|nr:conserved hypothetical protein [Leishmania major strain Friedlin]CAG9575178.1 hypothetical_protein_-_conserved [Leishmania major strain Friedlin]CAJ05339.1 conserved hypothetical protein [Leishmania major strain Friedlin]|eukprot:XP_001683916.1 conserved hypothetical protein [Leishmania major strain Friedlin]